MADHHTYPEDVDDVEDDSEGAGGLLKSEGRQEKEERLEGVRLRHRRKRLLQSSLKGSEYKMTISQQICKMTS